MTINATNVHVEEHVRSDKSRGEMTFRLIDPQTKAETGEERVIAMKGAPLRLEFFGRNVSTGMRVKLSTPLAPAKAMIPKLVQQAGKTHVGMGAFSRELKDVTWQ